LGQEQCSALAARRVSESAPVGQNVRGGCNRGAGRAIGANWRRDQRTRIVAIPLTIGEAELRQLMAISPYSRFPVYDGDIDHVVGLLLIKDFVRQQIERPNVIDIKALLRHIPIVPESMPVAQLLASFKRLHVHMALVVDKYGGTVGVVTLEDLVEEVVGEVRDEFDIAEQPPLREVAPGVLLGRLADRGSGRNRPCSDRANRRSRWRYCSTSRRRPLSSSHGCPLAQVEPDGVGGRITGGAKAQRLATGGFQLYHRGDAQLKSFAHWAARGKDVCLPQASLVISMLYRLVRVGTEGVSREVPVAVDRVGKGIDLRSDMPARWRSRIRKRPRLELRDTDVAVAAPEMPINHHFGKRE
jgi:hypothetical protein